MSFTALIDYITKRYMSIGIQCVLTFLTFIVIRYKYRRNSTFLELKKSTRKRLLDMFNPIPIIVKREDPFIFKNIKANFSNFDVFNLGSRYKKEIKETILEYGVGTCGPRGFYGTLDLHLDLENKLAELFHKDAAILYSNYFTCIQSVIPSFCKSRNNVFVDVSVSEAIKRGLVLSRSKIHTFTSLDDLEVQLKENFTDQYVICEKMGMNTGKILNLEKLIELKKKYGFRIILDESYSIPFMYQVPEERELYESVELIVGSLSHGYPANGAFCLGCKEAIDFERLAGCSYVFSASLPAYISKVATCMISEQIDYSIIRAKIALAFTFISKIITSRSSPIVLIETTEVSEKIRKLKESGYVVGRNGDYIRICINEKTREDDLKMIGEIIKSA